MKKKILITFFVLLLLIIMFILCGIEKRYFYVNSDDDSENILIKKNAELQIQLSANPDKNDLKHIYIDLIFNNLTENIIIKSANINIINNYHSHTKLLEVKATDGFYNWVEEKNGKASTFEKLPKHLKEINKEIKAYFLYNWKFKSNENDYLKINVSGNLLVGEKRIVLNRNINLKLKSEIIFRSPIRFH